MPDMLRLIALFGIVIVNVGYMAFPATSGSPDPTINGPFDQAATMAMRGIAEGKTYGLFSFMFGVGLGFQMRSAQRRGLPFGKLYRNRMIGLILLGLAHGIFFFSGDILVIYAITGSVLFLFRSFAPGRLIWIGVALLVLQTLLVLAFNLAPVALDPQFAAIEREIMTGGGVLDVLFFRAVSYGFTFPFLVFYQGSAALGWFCLGLAALKAGLIEDREHPLWRRARRLCFVPGVILSLMGAMLAVYGQGVAGNLVIVAAAPIATLGYLGLIAFLARPPGPIVSAFLKAGGSSLSVYLGQSIVLTTLFAPFGFGLWDAMGPGAAIGLAIVVTLALMGGVMLWRMAFALGPFEWVLRRITRLGSPASAGRDPS